MSAAVCGKRAASFFEEQQQQPLPHAASPTPSKRARLRGGGGGSPSPPPPRGADPGLVATIRARFPAVGLEFIGKALEECGNDLDLAIKFLRDYHVQPPDYNVPHPYVSPIGMSSEGQVPAKGFMNGNEVSAPVESVPCAESLPSNTMEWVDILVNEMTNASSTGDAKARALRVLGFFETSVATRSGAEGLKNLQKEHSVYKEQLEALIKENTILKKAVAIQHDRQKEHDERNQELRQMVVQYQDKVRSLEINNYALAMHLRQAQQGNSMAGHFNRDIF